MKLVHDKKRKKLFIVHSGTAEIVINTVKELFEREKEKEIPAYLVVEEAKKRHPSLNDQIIYFFLAKYAQKGLWGVRKRGNKLFIRKLS